MTYLLQRRAYRKLSVYQIMNNIFGLGPKTVKAIHRMLGTKKRIRFSRITHKQQAIMNRTFNYNLVTIKDYKRFYLTQIQNHKTNKSWKGLRILFGLPANGQRSKTNGATASRLKHRWDKLR